MRKLLAILLLSAAALPLHAANFTLILGQPTDHSITMGARADSAVELYYEYGLAPNSFTTQSQNVVPSADPYAVGYFVAQTLLDGLRSDTRYYYRLMQRTAGSSDAFSIGKQGSFQTQRRPGSSFSFAVQGDSHPERERNMFHPQLYRQTLQAVAESQPDFYVTSGDDFSVDTLQPPYTSSNVTGRYTLQLPYLDLLSKSSALFLGTGNHEQTSLSNYTRPPDSNNSNMVPVWAQNARNLYFPSPAPNDPRTGTFYTGNTTSLPGIGVLRDYYAWEWGDALFVVIDPYWSSPEQVDAGLGGQNSAGGRAQNRWLITHGDQQYEWLKRTLEQSKSRWKFVFAHHVMGTGRGGVEIARQFEWGGENANGTWGFTQNRPTWAQPLHQLMAANHVTIFFQAHDHLFARQQLDGVIYQSLPNPADNTYKAFNADAYESGDIFANSGFTRVTVAPDSVKVEYIRQWLPADERPPAQVSGTVQFAYTITAAGGPPPTIASAVAASSGAPALAPNAWVEIKGSNLAPADRTRNWQSADFVNNRMPTQLDGVSVSVNGKPAYVSYISPAQVNILTPPDALPETATVQVTVNGLTSAPFAVRGQAVAPSLFVFGAGPYVAATHADGALLGPLDLYTGLSTPARPGEIITVYGHGFGSTSIPVTSGSATQSGTLTAAPQFSVGGRACTVQFAGLVGPGLFQFNLALPADLPEGDQSILASYNGLNTQVNARVSIKR